MTERALSVERAARILSFLATHPTARFTLTELCGRLDINRASTLRILRALTISGLVERHPRHLTYQLGIMLVALGHAAGVQHPVVPTTRRQMEQLSDELAIQCSAVKVDEEGILIVAESGRGRLGIGIKLPQLPTMGLVHWAFTSEERREAWLTKTSFGKRQQQFLRRALRVIRERGFAIALDGPTRKVMPDLLEKLTDAPTDEQILDRMRKLWQKADEDESQLLRIAPTKVYAVAYLAAPIFGPSGAVELELVLRGLASRLTGQHIEAMAERLCQSCTLITRRTHGTTPS